ncbi:hypothetical protein GIB67_032502, partial [Kingdonia uniflora]
MTGEWPHHLQYPLPLCGWHLKTWSSGLHLKKIQYFATMSSFRQTPVVAPVWPPVCAELSQQPGLLEREYLPPFQCEQRRRTTRKSCRTVRSYLCNSSFHTSKLMTTFHFQPR